MTGTRLDELQAGATTFRAANAAPGRAGRSFFGLGFGMVAPTMLAHGTAAVHAYLPRMYSGELVGCQLFSEPG